ncbi:type II toxin-antitoxin system RelE/ParE family toxin [Phaeobacter sp. SYSU ZJ3003]|uniref:type II toxin-antitoxin system RelE/ParE family toxin n=1 Tax=Phaeobacter sp. SYSU ZJ3003 TaxID=2109330 RepID=UPI00351C9B60
MSRTFRLTRRAEESLIEIARWTIEKFGLRQADIYEAELLSRCEAIVNGQAHSRSCSILVADAEDLRYLRAGEHFLVFLDRPEEVIIVDVLHSRCDLPRHIAALTTLRSNET